VQLLLRDESQFIIGMSGVYSCRHTHEEQTFGLGCVWWVRQPECMLQLEPNNGFIFLQVPANYTVILRLIGRVEAQASDKLYGVTAFAWFYAFLWLLLLRACGCCMFVSAGFLR
jgi:hypothetical protein